MTVTSDAARAYFQRWKLVNEMEVAELRSTSVQVKMQQLASLMASREIFAADPDRNRDVQQVRERWALLQRTLRG